MNGGRLAGLVLLSTLAVLLALGLVPWRQSRALEVLRELDRVERELSLARSERGEQAERVRRLESRGRVVEEAGERLGLRLPSAEEVVILGVGSPSAGDAGEPVSGRGNLQGEGGP